MASRGEARCPRETDFKHFGNKSGRFYCKTYHFCVIARPQRGRGNLKVWGMASRGEAREYVARGKPYHKNMDSLRRFASSLFIPRFCFVPSYHISLRDDKSHRLRLPRRAQKCALLAMTNLMGFAGNRNHFRNETFEKRWGAILRKKTAKNEKHPFSK